MADTPITPIIQEITEMEAAFVQPSCNSKLPFVEYPSTGTPPQSLVSMFRRTPHLLLMGI